MIAKFFVMLSGFVFSVLDVILGFLPQMPFDLSALNDFMSNNIVITVISWINFFIPVSVCCGILALWSTAMLGYVGLKMAVNYSKGLG